MVFGPFLMTLTLQSLVFSTETPRNGQILLQTYDTLIKLEIFRYKWLQIVKYNLKITYFDGKFQLQIEKSAKTDDFSNFYF